MNLDSKIVPQMMSYRKQKASYSPIDDGQCKAALFIENCEADFFFSFAVFSFSVIEF
jgi:hypothetical protein